MISALVIIGIVGFVVTGVVSRRRRRQAIAATAAAREWTYQEVDRSLVDLYPGPPFDQGARRRVTNVVRGRYDGRDLLAFDHSYTTFDHSGSNTTSEQHEHSVVALSLGATFPPLSVSSEGSLSRLFTGFFGTDLELGDTAFDDAFRVSTDDPSYAREVLVPEVRTALLRHPELTWRFEQDALLTIRAGHHGADQIEPVVQALSEAVAAIPDRVWARVRGEDEPR